MQKLKALFVKYREIIIYMLVGIITTVVSWGAYIIFELVLGTFIENEILLASVSNVFSWIFTVIVAYITNKIWVFNSKSWKPTVVLREAGTFIASRIATGVLEWFGVPLLMIIGLDQQIFGIEGVVAKVIVSIIVVILNYVLSKLFVFRKKRFDKELDKEENT